MIPLFNERLYVSYLICTYLKRVTACRKKKEAQQTADTFTYVYDDHDSTSFALREMRFQGSGSEQIRLEQDVLLLDNAVQRSSAWRSPPRLPVMTGW